ncbi:AI-2E family transporter [candidate division KSB3 bacterium]|uniref:AI-2E family transporter n=1 Tax=candidate division KSB3 bacterium TaxID=2044937 RepID=A0A9D5JSF9_9BACT|nr:AI-2E family transporter [candidate division KSB3 bacterium]MBD3323179.1 AI-2E family transporter [candidate division KSB3 bacterium]
MKKKSSKSSGASPSQSYLLNHGHYFLFFLLFVSIYFSYKLLRPYLHPLILAIVLAILLNPVYRKFVDWFRGRRNLAAFVTCTLLTVVIVLPLTFLLFALIQQGVQSFNAIYDWVEAKKYTTLLDNPWVTKVTGMIEASLPNVQKLFPDFDLKNVRFDRIVLQTSSTIGKNLLNQGGQLFSNLSGLVIKFFLMLFAFFFLVRDQESIFTAVLHLIPLSGTQEERILDKIKSVTRSALLGTLITAVAQGIAGGIAFSIANLPGLFWGTMMAFASLVPVVGTAIIWIPAAVYLFLSGHWGYGIFLVAWSVLIVGLIDNFVRPIFMRGAGETMSTFVIFFSLLGGLHYFGLTGLLYGPLIIGLTMVFLYIYSVEFEAFLTQQDKH